MVSLGVCTQEYTSQCVLFLYCHHSDNHPQFIIFISDLSVLGTQAGSGTTFTVWYSTDSHESDPSTPPQGALVVSGLNSTSVTITLPDTDNSCKPYYVWISAITPNGQQSPYSRRRQVEVCRMHVCTCEHSTLTLSCLVSIL